MKDDTQKALEELQEKLLSDEPVTDEAFSELKFSDEKFLGEDLFNEDSSDEGLSDDALLEDIINEVHAEQKAELHKPAERPSKAAPREQVPAGEIAEEKPKEDLVKIVLMFAVSALSLGVSGLLIYWLVNYL